MEGAYILAGIIVLIIVIKILTRGHGKPKEPSEDELDDEDDEFEGRF